MTTNIDEKNQEIAALADEIFEEQINERSLLCAAFSSILCDESWRDALAHDLATFFWRCQVIKGAQHSGEDIDTDKMLSDESTSMHRQLTAILTPYFRRRAVECAIEQTEESCANV